MVVVAGRRRISMVRWRPSLLSNPEAHFNDLGSTCYDTRIGAGGYCRLPQHRFIVGSGLPADLGQPVLTRRRLTRLILP